MLELCLQFVQIAYRLTSCPKQANNLTWFALAGQNYPSITLIPFVNLALVSWTIIRTLIDGKDINRFVSWSNPFFFFGERHEVPVFAERMCLVVWMYHYHQSFRGKSK